MVHKSYSSFDFGNFFNRGSSFVSDSRLPCIEGEARQSDDSQSSRPHKTIWDVVSSQNKQHDDRHETQNKDLLSSLCDFDASFEDRIGSCVGLQDAVTVDLVQSCHSQSKQQEGEIVILNVGKDAEGCSDS